MLIGESLLIVKLILSMSSECTPFGVYVTGNSPTLVHLGNRVFVISIYNRTWRYDDRTGKTTALDFYVSSSERVGITGTFLTQYGLCVDIDGDEMSYAFRVRFAAYRAKGGWVARVGDNVSALSYNSDDTGVRVFGRLIQSKDGLFVKKDDHWYEVYVRNSKAEIEKVEEPGCAIDWVMPSSECKIGDVTYCIETYGNRTSLVRHYHYDLKGAIKSLEKLQLPFAMIQTVVSYLDGRDIKSEHERRRLDEIQKSNDHHATKKNELAAARSSRSSARKDVSRLKRILTGAKRKLERVTEEYEKSVEHLSEWDQEVEELKNAVNDADKRVKRAKKN